MIWLLLFFKVSYLVYLLQHGGEDLYYYNKLYSLLPVLTSLDITLFPEYYQST